MNLKIGLNLGLIMGEIHLPLFSLYNLQALSHMQLRAHAMFCKCQNKIMHPNKKKEKRPVLYFYSHYRDH